MKNHLPILLSISFLFLLISSINAQKKHRQKLSDSDRFNAGLVIGFNNAQIDGDYFTGFDKFGLTGGIRGITKLTPRWEFNIEMLYSKKGSKILQNRSLSSARQGKDRIIDLTYIDAPFFFKYYIKDLESIWHVEVGTIYSRLVKTKITENVTNSKREFIYEDAVEDFTKDDISFLFGFGYSWKNGMAINFRYNFSAKKFYQNTNYERPILGSTVSEPVDFLRNYYYSVNFSYDLFK